MNFVISLGMYICIFLEMKLSIATDRPVAIRHTTRPYPNQRAQTYTTFLTGSVDYLVLANCGPRALSSDRISAEKQQEILSHKTLSSLIAKNGPLNQKISDVLNYLRLLHVEAKRDKEKQELKDYRPQAIGETLAT